MEIPVEERPLAVPAEMPYFQPIMSSDTTWSNTEGEGAASFGCSISGYSMVYPRWNALTPRTTSAKKTDGTYAWYSADPKKPIIITFEHPLKLRRVEVAQRVPSDREGPNWLKLTGDGRVLLDFYDTERDWGICRYRWFSCADIGYFMTLRVYYSYGSGSGSIDAAQLFPLVLDALYRPADLHP